MGLVSQAEIDAMLAPFDDLTVEQMEFLADLETNDCGEPRERGLLVITGVSKSMLIGSSLVELGAATVTHDGNFSRFEITDRGRLVVNALSDRFRDALNQAAAALKPK